MCVVRNKVTSYRVENCMHKNVECARTHANTHMRAHTHTRRGKHAHAHAHARTEAAVNKTFLSKHVRALRPRLVPGYDAIGLEVPGSGMRLIRAYRARHRLGHRRGFRLGHLVHKPGLHDEGMQNSGLAIQSKPGFVTALCRALMRVST